jgi:hypothetical protein
VRAAAEAGQVAPQLRQPDALLRALWREEYDVLLLIADQTLYQHESDEGLAQTHAIAEEGAPVLASDVDEGPVRLLLIPIEDTKHLRTVLLPVSRRRLDLGE